MALMIGRVDDRSVTNEVVGDVIVASRVLAVTVSEDDDVARRAAAPFVDRDPAARAGERAFLWCRRV